MASCGADVVRARPIRAATQVAPGRASVNGGSAPRRTGSGFDARRALGSVHATSMMSPPAGVRMLPPPRTLHAIMSDDRTLDAAFLGPLGENADLLERLVVDALRDHTYWRRNFHPEDAPTIPATAGSATRWTSRATSNNTTHYIRASGGDRGSRPHPQDQFFVAGCCFC
jgi:hypothetical protein